MFLSFLGPCVVSGCCGRGPRSRPGNNISQRLWIAKPLQRSARFARCARSLTALALQLIELPGASLLFVGPAVVARSPPKIHLEILEKSLSEPSKIGPQTHQKPFQNRSRMGSETGSKTESHLGPLFATFFRGPGRVWGRPGAVLVPKLGLPERPKTPPKSIPKSMEFRRPSRPPS